LSLFSLFALVFVMAAFAPCAIASTNVDIGDEAYDALLRLEAEGLIRSGLLTTRPISRREAARLLGEAESNSEGRGPFIKTIIRTLKKEFGDENGAEYIKPLDKTYVEFTHSDQAGQELNYNNDGDTYARGANLRLGLASRADLGWLSYHINPELRHSEDDEEVALEKAYAVLSHWGLELEAGKDSQWWGPGRHGALLLSNNAVPLTIIKLTNPHPALLPWAFKHLGPFRFVLFASRLEAERVVPEVYFWGLRLNFKPSPYVEIGLQRMSLLGGDGHPQDLEAWVKSFLFLDRGSGDSSDHRVSFDAKVTLPLDWLPLQLYGEIGVEDGGLPSFVADIVGYDGESPMTAYLVGLHMPRLPGIERAGLTVEYATTRADNRPDAIWYTHSIYKTGHSYKGRFMGHHMGPEAEDIFIELSYLLPELGGGVRISYDRECHHLPDVAAQGATEEIAASINLEFKSGLEVEGRLAAGRMDNGAGPDENTSLVMLRASYRY